mgnify:FL=1
MYISSERLNYLDDAKIGLLSLMTASTQKAMRHAEELK